MSTKAEVILDEIRSLSSAEIRELHRQVGLLAAATDEQTSRLHFVSDEEFESALVEVTGCTVGGGALQRLLNGRRRDRERDEAFLSMRKGNSDRG